VDGLLELLVCIDDLLHRGSRHVCVSNAMPEKACYVRFGLGFCLTQVAARCFGNFELEGPQFAVGRNFALGWGSEV
jgi:hypothetical protein